MRYKLKHVNADGTSIAMIPEYLCGLPNLGHSCWWNCVVHLLLHSATFHHILDTFEAPPSTLHFNLQQLRQSIKDRDPTALEKHHRCFRFVCQLHPTFQQSSLNDAHEVLTYVINTLHDESRHTIPHHLLVAMPTDKATRAIFRDYQNSVSNVLKHLITCIEETRGDGSTHVATYTHLFIEPKVVETAAGVPRASFQAALDDMNIVYKPSVLFLTMIHDRQSQANISGDLKIGGVEYKCIGMTLFIPHVAHYVAVFRNVGALKDCPVPVEEQKNMWLLIDDERVSFVSSQDLARLNLTPTVIMYEKSNVA